MAVGRHRAFLTAETTGNWVPFPAELDRKPAERGSSPYRRSVSTLLSEHAYREAARPDYALIRISPGFHSPLRTALPNSSSAGVASTMVSNLRSDPQSRPQSSDR